jgi:hypothetical protein
VEVLPGIFKRGDLGNITMTTYQRILPQPIENPIQERFDSNLIVELNIESIEHCSTIETHHLSIILTMAEAVVQLRCGVKVSTCSPGILHQY